LMLEIIMFCFFFFIFEFHFSYHLRQILEFIGETGKKMSIIQ